MIRVTAVALAVLLVPALVEAQQAAAGERTHTVETGETLGSIARDYLGAATEWRQIYEANRDAIANPDRISVGMTLVIPGEGAPEAPARVTAVDVTGPAAPAQDLSSYQSRRELLESRRFEPAGAPEVPVAERTVFFDIPSEEDEAAMVVVQPPEMVSAVAEGVFQAAGWIIPVGTVDEPLGEITGFSVDQIAGPGRSSIQLYETVHVRFDAEGSPPVGERFLAYDVSRSIETVGRIGAPTGVIEIIQEGEGEAVGQVVEGYAKIAMGNRLTRLRTFPLDVGVHPEETNEDLEGRILGFQKSKELYLPGDYAFLDLGADADLSVGDVFVGRAEDGDDWTARELARFQVVGVGEGTSTVRIVQVKSPDAVRPGLRTVLVRRMP